MRKNILYDMVEIAMLVSIAIVLDKFVKIPIGIGSINISMFPLFIIALRHGAIKGFVASGIVYGLICCLTDGYGLITYPLEYLVAYGSVFFLGVLSKKIFMYYESNDKFNTYFLFILSMVISILIRFCCGVIDSIWIYELTIDEAIIYNIPYVVISGILTIVIMALLFKVFYKLCKRYKTSHLASVL